MQSGQKVAAFSRGRRVSALHAPDDGVAEPGAGHQRGAGDQPLQILFDVLARRDVALRGADGFAQAREVVGHLLGGNRVGDAVHDEVRGFLPADVAQHHLRRQDQRAGIHAILAGKTRRGAVRGLEHREAIADVAAGRDADAAHLRRERVRDVIAVEIQRGDDVVVFRPQQHLLQEIVRDHVLDDDFMAVDRVLEAAPRPGADGLARRIPPSRVDSPTA